MALDFDLKRCCRCQVEYPATTEHFHRQSRRGRHELTSQCKECRRKMHRHQYAKNRKKYIAKASERTKLRRERPEVQLANRIASRLAKREKLADPAEREKHRKRTREWFRKNNDRVRLMPSRDKALGAAYTAKYNATKLRATPAWSDLEAIKRIYKEARRLTEKTGVPHDVDHIVPLRHKKASGLHVPENLRVVTASVNRSKCNRLISI